MKISVLFKRKWTFFIFFVIFSFLLISNKTILYKSNMNKVDCNTDLIPTNAQIKNFTMTPSYSISWIDNSDGTLLSLVDRSDTTTDLPFNFDFYDIMDQTEIYITSEGYLTFIDINPVQEDPIKFPSSNGKAQYIIAPYWANLDVSSGNIYVKNYSSYWVVSYLNMYNEVGGLIAGSFEVILYNTGTIIFIYQSLGNLTTYECGLNKGDAVYANSYNGFSDPTTDFAIRFSKPSSNWGGGGGGNDDDIGDTDNTAPVVAGVVIFITIGAVAGVSAFYYRKDPEQFKATMRKSKGRLQDTGGKFKNKLKIGGEKLKDAGVIFKDKLKESREKLKPRMENFKEKVKTSKENLNVKFKGLSEKLREKKSDGE